jgi:hypothetical protein
MSKNGDPIHFRSVLKQIGSLKFFKSAGTTSKIRASREKKSFRKCPLMFRRLLTLRKSRLSSLGKIRILRVNKHEC